MRRSQDALYRVRQLVCFTPMFKGVWHIEDIVGNVHAGVACTPRMKASIKTSWRIQTLFCHSTAASAPRSSGAASGGGGDTMAAWRWTGPAERELGGPPGAAHRERLGSMQMPSDLYRKMLQMI